MKCVKSLGLLAVAAAALMAFAPSASATEITSSTGTTPNIHASAGEITLHAIATITCNSSTVSGTVTEHSNGTPKGSISTLDFTGCNNHVTVLTNGTGLGGTGTLEVHTQGATTNGNGTLTSNGTRVTVKITSLGISCVYETQNTHIGTYTAATATLEIESANIKRLEEDSKMFCGGNGTLTGAYNITHPTGLNIH